VRTRFARGGGMDSPWSFYYWIDDFAGQLGTVVILGAPLAGESLGAR